MLADWSRPLLVPGTGSVGCHLDCSEVAFREVQDNQRTGLEVCTGHPQLADIRKRGGALFGRGRVLLREGAGRKRK